MHIYIVGFDGFLKIGKSADVWLRVKTLQTGCPEPLRCHGLLDVPPGAASAIERGAHRALSEYRTSGEWFRLQPEVAKAAVMSEYQVAVGCAPGEWMELRPPEARVAPRPFASDDEEIEAYFNGSLKARSPSEIAASIAA